ncbi:MAG TPA: hypothetical protein VK988_18435 [Acidimicrobiales bacterium]|nr:hypothetical protein [Acidimicrobiales bacterium]
MRRAVAILTLGTAMVLGPASAASADHTGCKHRRTGQAHKSVPHRNHGNHQAHQSIPYCPPEDAPRHRQ